MGDFRNDCCEPADCVCECCETSCEPCASQKVKCECCCRPSGCSDQEGNNGFGILILLVVLYFIFCSDSNHRGGGLLGGLF